MLGYQRKSANIQQTQPLGKCNPKLIDIAPSASLNSSHRETLTTNERLWGMETCTLSLTARERIAI